MTAQRTAAWLRRMMGRPAAAAGHEDTDAADLGTCFGLEAAFEAETAPQTWATTAMRPPPRGDASPSPAA